MSTPTGATLEQVAPPAPDTVHPPQAASLYEARAARFKEELDRETRVWERVANLRLAAFLLAALALGVGFWLDAPALQAAGAALLLAFVALATYHRAVARRKRRAEELWKINVEAISRLRRAWDALPLRHAAQAGPDEQFARDLDLFGHASLFHLLDTTTTHLGESALASWLRAPAPPEEAAERRPAVAELASHVDFRDELELRGRLANDERPDPEGFLAWAESEPWLARRAWLRWGAVASVGALWLLAAAQIAGLVNYPLWAAFAFLNTAVTLAVVRPVYARLSSAATREAGFRHFSLALQLICEATFSAPRLKAMQARLGVGGLSAPASMKRLYRLTTFTVPPSAALYLPVQAFTMWDLHLLAAFERWQRESGKHVRDWLQALGEAEALSALARLAHDNPGWDYPIVDATAESLSARDLGHPLIPEERRVANDVEVGPPGTFLFVTGSNMSGKSTLLRALGLNVVLAGAGGPACASSLRLPPVHLQTSMRIEDSLEMGVSYYMAELQRLKAVVDAARDDPGPGGRRLFYLLDEILQGTNTAERQIAARRVILYLVRRGAIGAVSTHDLTLASDPEVAAAARPVHFTETLSHDAGGPAMTFDYKLRPGVATSTNALRLMQIVGLDLDGDHD